MRTVERRVPGLVLREHELEVPLDHTGTEEGEITVFAREVCDPDGLDRPFLVFFQGGPGFEATRPSTRPSSPGWLMRALEDFRVLLLDQRGTGRSTPVGTLSGMSPGEQAAYLKHFRADAIVDDAESFREALGVDRWSALGQSFGGMCVTRYLSAAPDSLDEAYITGGLPPVGRPVDDVFTLTWARMVERTLAHYSRYPEDRERILALQRDPVTLPSGRVLTPDWVRCLGSPLGFSDGSEDLHHLLELPRDSPAFLHDAEAALPFAWRNPIYLVVHEACWADPGPTRWSAERTRPPIFDHQPELLSGEHPQRFMLEGWPLREAAELLAEHDWPRLYDEDVLATNDVPAAAVIYADDPYVPRELSEETAALIGGLQPWITNEYLHNGLRADGATILDHLIGLARGRR